VPIRLSNPLQTVTLDLARIAAMKIETNPCIGQMFVEIWVIVGRLEDGKLVQYPDPRTGQPAAWYFKIEDGNHPMAPNRALGRCPNCGAWHQTVAGVCGVEGCEGVIVPYDGMTRLCMAAPSGACMYEAIQNAAYAFLLGEKVPDPVTGELVKLLDGTVE